MSFEVNKPQTSFKQVRGKRDSVFVNKPEVNIGEEINGVKIDGKIGDFKQGTKPDCVFLSMILGLSFTEWGQRAFDKAIDSDGNGGAFVTFNEDGKKTYHITNEEILDAKNLAEKEYSVDVFTKLKQLKNDYDTCKISGPVYRIEVNKIYSHYATGDDDVLAMEIALEKYTLESSKALLDYYSRYNSSSFKELVNDPINFGFFNPRATSGLILGDGSCFKVNYESVKTRNAIKVLLDYLQENLHKENILANISFFKSEIPQNDYIEYSNDSPASKALASAHAYALKGFETNAEGVTFVLLVNPHDSKSLIRLPYHYLISIADCVEISANEGIQAELNEICKQANSESFDLKSHLEDEKAKLLQINFNCFLQDCINSSLEERENIINDYFKSFVSSQGTAQEKKGFIEQFKNNIEELITSLDEAESGWGKGAAKKASIKPIIDNLCNAILSFDKQDINSEEFKHRQFYKYYENCINELDAIFYTDENKIIENLKELTIVYENVLENFFEEKI